MDDSLGNPLLLLLLSRQRLEQCTVLTRLPMATQNFAGTSQLIHYTAEVLSSLATMSTPLNTSQRTTLRSSMSTSLTTHVVKHRRIPTHISQPGGGTSRPWWTRVAWEAETWGSCCRVAGVAGAAPEVEAVSTVEELMRCRVLGNPRQTERPATGPVPACRSCWSKPSNDG